MEPLSLAALVGVRRSMAITPCLLLFSGPLVSTPRDCDMIVERGIISRYARPGEEEVHLRVRGS